MAQDGHRQVSIARVAAGKYAVTNERGGTIAVGTGGVELLLAAIGTCTSADVDVLTSRRAEPVSFTVDVGAEKVHDLVGNRLKDIAVTFHVSFPAGEGGDAARALLPGAVRRSHDSLCTVGKTVELGTPIATEIAPVGRLDPEQRTSADRLKAALRDNPADAGVADDLERVHEDLGSASGGEVARRIILDADGHAH